MTDNEWIDESRKVLPLDEVIHNHIVHALRVTHGNIQLTADLLKRNRQTVFTYVEKNGLADEVWRLKRERRRLISAMTDADRREKARIRRQNAKR